jgi:outer membrane lipoprotein LolB
MSWRGRLALRIESALVAGAPQNQSFSAGFELLGTQQQGDLFFYTPLGNTAAAIHWDASKAVIQSKGETHTFENLSALIENLLGTEVPVAALFSWLNGRPVDSDGWQVDLSQRSQGKILARRLTPAPPAELRVILEN